MSGIVVIYVLLFLFCRISRQQDYGDDLNVISVTERGVFDEENIEKYEYENGITFLLMIYRLSWEEAEVVCRARNGSLAVFKNKDKLDFMAKILTESDLLTYASVWIGGEYNGDTKTWSWVDKARSPIETQFPPGETFPRESFPPWLEEPAKMNSTSRCLAADRYNHLTPVFVPMPCHLQRSFLCEMHGDPRDDDSDELGVPGMRFHVFHRLLSWDAAYLACRDGGWDLAVLDSARPLPTATHIMRRHRPAVDFAWIGARYVPEKDSWLWINDDALANTTGGYPPWFNDEVGVEGCLMLDREPSKEPAFVAEPCATHRPFICQEDINQGKDPVGEFYQVEGTKMLMSKREKSWFDAFKSCERRKLNLLTFSNNMQHMGDLIAHLRESMINARLYDFEASLDNVWLGARLTDGKWRWVSGEDGGFTNKDSFKYGPGANEVIGFCKEEQLNERAEMDCLNLTRENHAELVLYGMMCNFTQRYICV